MKKEIIIWQLITVALGIFLIITLRTYLQDKNEILAETNRANCMIETEEKNMLQNICSDIKTYKLQDSSHGFLK